MAFTEFYCDFTNGANVNGGSDAGSPSMSDTAGTGAVSTVTHQYTSVITSGAVAVGQFISIYSGAATVPAFTARITAVSGGAGSVWVITYSTTAKTGTEPTTGATYKANVGGAWKGPNAAEAHPFGTIAGAMTNAAGDKIRVNFKNNATYSITAAMTHALTGFVQWEGYTTTAGDGGRANIDGGTSGASYVLLTLGGANDGHRLKNLIFSNNGATGSASGVFATTSGASNTVTGCVFHDLRGTGLASAAMSVVECEAYNCNQSNTAALAGFTALGASKYVRCVSHDNSGSATAGFRSGSASSATYAYCIADTNGGIGFSVADSIGATWMESCDAYNNGSHGASITVSSGFGYSIQIENCNFVKNAGWGISFSASGALLCGAVMKCGFGSGTQENTSGTITNGGPLEVTDSIAYAADVTPWVDPANGDFRINLAAAKGTGRGAFTETAASYAGTVAYPDVGAGQHVDAGGGAPTFGPAGPLFRGVAN